VPAGDVRRIAEKCGEDLGVGHHSWLGRCRTRRGSRADAVRHRVMLRAASRSRGALFRARSIARRGLFRRRRFRRALRSAVGRAAGFCRARSGLAIAFRFRTRRLSARGSVTIPADISIPVGTTGRLPGGVKLPLQRPDHAAEGLRGPNQQRIVERGFPARGKCLSLPGHSKLLLAGCCPRLGLSKGRAKRRPKA